MHTKTTTTWGGGHSIILDVMSFYASRCTVQTECVIFCAVSLLMGFLLHPPWHSGDGSTPHNCQSITCDYTLRKELVMKSVPVKYCSALSSLELITHICHKVLGCDLGGFYLIHYVQKYLHARFEP